MNLYAEITGDRLIDGVKKQVSKGQGGNTMLSIEIMDKDSRVLIAIDVYEKDEGVAATMHVMGDSRTGKELTVWRDDNGGPYGQWIDTTGNKQKGINKCEHIDTTNTVHGRYCLNCHAYL